MRYTALKSCRIGGKNYNKGDIIQPDELSAYEGLKLVRYGILCELPINAEEMVEPIQFVLQMSATDAAEYIKNINSDSVCDVLGAVDTRKTVLAAISKHTTEQEEDSGGDE